LADVKRTTTDRRPVRANSMEIAGEGLVDQTRDMRFFVLSAILTVAW
jgi:hypothetical protein